MIFLSATSPNVALSVYGADFSLSPIGYPDVDVSQILAVENPLGRRILRENSTNIQRIKFEAHRLPGYPAPLPPLDQVQPASRILIIRGGGIGDVLMCTPVISVLRERLMDKAHLTLATFKQYEKLFRSNPSVDAVTSEPLTLGELMHADYYVEFDGSNSLMESTPMTDFYLGCIGIDPWTVSDKTPVLPIDDLIDTSIIRIVDAAGIGYHRKVYLNGLASDKLRDLSPELLSAFPRNFPKILFMVPESYEDRYGSKATALLNTPNVMRLNTEGSLPGYVTAVHCSDAVVTTDSSAYHIAAALEKPCLTLFGSIDPRLRTRYYPRVISLKAPYAGHTCQPPCGKSMLSDFHSEAVDREEKCPEARIKGIDFSPCLESFLENEGRLIDSFMQTINFRI